MTYHPLELAAAFIQTGELDDALVALNQHLDENPADDDARRMRIKVLQHLGDEAGLRAAQDDFARLPTHTLNDVISYSLLLEQSGDHDGALATIAQGYRRWPANERIIERYLQLLARANDTETALSIVRQQPRTWRWWQWEGDILAMQGDDTTATARYGLALASLDNMLGDDPYAAPVKASILLARAHAYRRLQHFQQADDHYAAAAQLVPNDPTITFARGLLRFLQGEMAVAAETCRSALAEATPALYKQMLDELHGDERYRPLAAQLQDIR